MHLQKLLLPTNFHSFHEYRAVLHENLSAAFALFDADGDGKLTEAEVIAALTRKTDQQTELSEEAARETWQHWKSMFDHNKDGKISIDEVSRTPT